MASKKKKNPDSAKKLRKDEERHRRLRSVTHIAHTSLAVNNRVRKQSRRWLRHQLKRPDRRGISSKAEHEIYLYLKSSRADGLSSEAQQALSRLETERAGAREAAGTGGVEWVGDWFDGGGESMGLELEAGGVEGDKDTGEAESSGDGQERRGSVFLSPVLGAEVEMGKIPGGERGTGEGESMKLPFRGRVSDAGTQ